MVNALREAHRVLRDDGLVFVLEPVPEGNSHEVGVLIDDETHVRGLAQEALRHARDIGFEEVKDGAFVAQAVYEDLAAWESHMVGIDPTRAAAMETH